MVTQQESQTPEELKSALDKAFKFGTSKDPAKQTLLSAKKKGAVEEAKKKKEQAKLEKLQPKSVADPRAVAAPKGTVTVTQRTPSGQERTVSTIILRDTGISGRPRETPRLTRVLSPQETRSLESEREFKRKQEEAFKRATQPTLFETVAEGASAAVFGERGAKRPFLGVVSDRDLKKFQTQRKQEETFREIGRATIETAITIPDLPLQISRAPIVGERAVTDLEFRGELVKEFTARPEFFLTQAAIGFIAVPKGISIVRSRLLPKPKQFKVTPILAVEERQARLNIARFQTGETGTESIIRGFTTRTGTRTLAPEDVLKRTRKGTKLKKDVPVIDDKVETLFVDKLPGGKEKLRAASTVTRRREQFRVLKGKPFVTDKPPEAPKILEFDEFTSFFERQTIGPEGVGRTQNIRRILVPQKGGQAPDPIGSFFPGRGTDQPFPFEKIRPIPAADTAKSLSFRRGTRGVDEVTPDVAKSLDDASIRLNTDAFIVEEAPRPFIDIDADIIPARATSNFNVKAGRLDAQGRSLSFSSDVISVPALNVKPDVDTLLNTKTRGVEQEPLKINKTGQFLIPGTFRLPRTGIGQIFGKDFDTKFKPRATINLRPDFFGSEGGRGRRGGPPGLPGFGTEELFTSKRKKKARRGRRRGRRLIPRADPFSEIRTEFFTASKGLFPTFTQPRATRGTTRKFRKKIREQGLFVTFPTQEELLRR